MDVKTGLHLSSHPEKAVKRITNELRDLLRSSSPKKVNDRFLCMIDPQRKAYETTTNKYRNFSYMEVGDNNVPLLF